MRRLFRATFRIALMVGLLAVVRQLLLDRQPNKALNGTEPVIGSFDTWPEVPRKP
jgi:hypothetical protein